MARTDNKLGPKPVLGHSVFRQRAGAQIMQDNPSDFPAKPGKEGLRRKKLQESTNTGGGTSRYVRMRAGLRRQL